MSAANQKTITITNKPPCDKNHPYTVTNLSAKYFAMRKLQSLAGYKLWEYLAANQENYTIELSQVAIEKTCGIKKAAYNSAVQELIDKLNEIEDKSQQVFHFDDSDIEELEEDSGYVILY